MKTQELTPSEQMIIQGGQVQKPYYRLIGRLCAAIVNGMENIDQSHAMSRRGI